MWPALYALVVLAVVVRGQATTREVVLADQGTVRGYMDESGAYYRFLDVPYATAPNGSNKFKGPLPPPVWSDTFDAVYRGISCTQGASSPPVDTQDDCLVANIFVPDVETPNLPVLVYVHGGGFIMGRGGIQYGSLMERKRTVIVTFNYRLGIQGFLCLGTKDVPGNAGMKDQVALLRWVKKNIANFGGNPNDVTLDGCSAGGASIDLLTLSPLSAGLFEKAIIASGAAFGYVGPMIDPIHNAKIYARLLNFTNVDDINALEEFYKTTPNEILNFDALAQFYNTVMLFAPCIERDTGTGEEIFLSVAPRTLVNSGNYVTKPLLYGYAEMEGIFQITFFNQYNETIEGMSRNFSHYLPLDLQFESVEERDAVAEVVRQFYFGDTINQDSVLQYVMYYTDYMFVHPMLTGLRLRRNSKQDTVYFYEYEFVDEHSHLVPNTDIRGAHHCAQAEMVDGNLKYKYPFIVKYTTPGYLQMQEQLKEMWLNFAETGRPVPENATSLPAWLPVEDEWTPHMIFRNNNSAMSESVTAGVRARFWDIIYERHYRPPMPPNPNKAVSTTHSILIMCASVFTALYIL